MVKLLKKDIDRVERLIARSLASRRYDDDLIAEIIDTRSKNR